METIIALLTVYRLEHQNKLSILILDASYAREKNQSDKLASIHRKVQTERIIIQEYTDKINELSK